MSTTGTTYAIQAEGLTKRFGAFIAVNAISFQVGQGEIFGFLGANGAGKTTAMRMLCGLSRPSAGQARVGVQEFIDALHAHRGLLHLRGDHAQAGEGPGELAHIEGEFGDVAHRYTILAMDHQHAADEDHQRRAQPHQPVDQDRLVIARLAVEARDDPAAAHAHLADGHGVTGLVAVPEARARVSGQIQGQGEHRNRRPADPGPAFQHS